MTIADQYDAFICDVGASFIMGGDFSGRSGGADADARGGQACGAGVGMYRSRAIPFPVNSTASAFRAQVGT